MAQPVGEVAKLAAAKHPTIIQTKVNPQNKYLDHLEAN
jgi:hypothetical protein